MMRVAHELGLAVRIDTGSALPISADQAWAVISGLEEEFRLTSPIANSALEARFDTGKVTWPELIHWIRGTLPMILVRQLAEVAGIDLESKRPISESELVEIGYLLEGVCGIQTDFEFPDELLVLLDEKALTWSRLAAFLHEELPRVC